MQNTGPALPPLTAVAYLVVTGQQNPQILNEFLHSFTTLRRFHPDIPVLLYHQNLTGEQLDFVRRLRGVLDFPIAVDATGRFPEHGFRMKSGHGFPELRVLASKVDVLLLTPGDTLFLDTDTEVRAPLDDVFASPVPWLHESEGLLREHDRELASLLAATNWTAMGWRGDLERLCMYNTGSIWVPQSFKQHLYRAKEYMWSLVAVPAQDRGDNRLDEQISLSIALSEATEYAVGEVAPRVYHFWRERYENEPAWYLERFTPAQGEQPVVLHPPRLHDPAVAPLLL